VPTPINGLRDEDPRIELESDEIDVDLYDGTDPALRAGGEVGKAAGASLLGSRVVSPTDQQRDAVLAFALNKTKRLRKEVRRLRSSRGPFVVARPVEDKLQLDSK
jgi:hypothetical protein